MKKSFFYFIVLFLFTNNYSFGGRIDACSLAIIMTRDGINVTAERYRGARVTGQGIVRDIEHISTNPATYHISLLCNGFGGTLVYVQADYNRMRSAGSKVTFEGEVLGTHGWKEFPGSNEPYITIILEKGRVSFSR